MSKIRISDKFDNLYDEIKTTAQLSEIIEIDISKLTAGQYQPRSNFDAEAIENLAASIKEHGVIQPILLNDLGDEKYEIIAGERRVKASKLAGLKTIPAIVRTEGDYSKASLALIENLQREDLNPLEEAEAFQKLIEEFHLTHEQISKNVGKSRSSISNALRLLDLSAHAKLALNARSIEMGHARALLALSEKNQIDAVNKIINEQLNVRQTEQLVQSIKHPIPVKTSFISREAKEQLEIWRQRLLPHSSQVKIKMDRIDNISVNIKCSSLDEAEQLLTEVEKLKS